MSAPAALDAQLVRQRFDRAATQYGNAAVVQREVGNRLLERFDVMRIDPRVVLDVGCGPGTHTDALVKRFPNAQIVALDTSAAMLEKAAPAASGWLDRWSKKPRALGVCADMSRLPIAQGVVDVLWSNFSMQWGGDLPALFSQWSRAIRNDGVLMFTAPGPDTLKELRQTLAQIESPDLQRAHSFTDLHDLGDMLIHAGFADPVMDMEVITLEYNDTAALWRDLRDQAALSAIAARPRGLLTPRKFAALNAALDRSRDGNGKIRMSIEVIYGHAWKVPPKKTAEGHGIVRIDAIKRGPRQ
ncbi:MAG: methyltransferase domain-containing protein [Betaproteobacteria bacterium]|nr:MAG: methyltransferase domain-containing protein [Betaproteobacteria bacterium]